MMCVNVCSDRTDAVMAEQLADCSLKTAHKQDSHVACHDSRASHIQAYMCAQLKQQACDE